MICKRCGQHPATVHLTDVLNKARRVQHICEACARSHQLIPTPDDPEQPLGLIRDLLLQGIESGPDAQVTRLDAAREQRCQEIAASLGSRDRAVFLRCLGQ